MTGAATVVTSIPFAPGMERALSANFAIPGGPRPAGDFPVPAAGDLDIQARGLAP